MLKADKKWRHPKQLRGRGWHKYVLKNYKSIQVLISIEPLEPILDFAHNWTVVLSPISLLSDLDTVTIDYLA